MCAVPLALRLLGPAWQLAGVPKLFLVSKRQIEEKSNINAPELLGFIIYFHRRGERRNVKKLFPPKKGIGYFDNCDEFFSVPLFHVHCAVYDRLVAQVLLF